MPIRPRRRLRRTHLLVREYFDMVLGPAADSPIPTARFEELLAAYPDRFGDDSWVTRYLGTGWDDRELMELDPDEPVGCPGCAEEN